MNYRALFVLFALLFAFIAPAQINKEKTMKSREILNKAHMLDHLTHLLPLVMTKSQISALLSGIEKARAKEDDITLREHTELLTLEAKIDAEVEKGVKKGEVPSDIVLKELSRTFTAFSARRMAVADENTEALLTVLKATLNAGQLKTAGHSIDPKAYDPQAKTETMSEDERLRYFIKAVLLDWTCYDVLVKLAAIAH